MRQFLRTLLVMLVAVGGGLALSSGTLVGCQSTHDPAEADNDDVGNDNADGSEVHNHPQPDPGPQPSDSFDQARDRLLAEFAEQLHGRGLSQLSIPTVAMPTRREMFDGFNSGGRNWLDMELVAHHNDYVASRGRQLYLDLRQTVTSAPVFGELVESDGIREELTRMILASHTDDFSPDATRELGQFQAAEAILFTRLSTSFERLRRVGPFTAHAYWMRGEYRLEARLVHTERATTLWHGSANWERTFIADLH